MDNYKTPLFIRERAKQRRDAIKADGGEAYELLLAKERTQRKLFRQRHKEKPKYKAAMRAARRKREKISVSYRLLRLVIVARRRGRKAGLEATIRKADLIWPTHCPVLGIELDYKTQNGSRKFNNPANPSLDRWDNSKGYVPGNVFVISLRANQLKNNATADELEAVAGYARHGLSQSVR